MAHIETKKANQEVNFLASAVGLITKSTTVKKAGVSTVDGRKVVKAGTVYPSNDENAEGILLYEVDVTNGDTEGALIVAGRIMEERLPVEVEETAKAALAEKGIYFDAIGETERTEE